ncbi:CHY zinc finger protein (plasmid) [Coraliomargarita sp. W4R53]
MSSDSINVYGLSIDEQTRCVHYSTERDIVAIRFFCCELYYPCHLCHEETSGHRIEVWPRELFCRKAIACGACRHEFSIQQYLTMDHCTSCASEFNPGCSTHHHLYFSTDSAQS